MLRTLLTTLLLLPLSLLAQALELPDHHPVPGGIARIELDVAGNRPPKVLYNDHRVMVVDAGNEGEQRWTALVGIPLSAKSGAHQIQVNGKPRSFVVQQKNYEEQHITIKNKRKVNPTALDMKRINREKKEILGALASWSETEQPVTRLLKPAQGPYSSPFGLRRFFNEQPRKPHSGLDIAAPAGTPIIAPAPGKVVATGDYFFNGRTVILDHGHGLTSLYCHMDRIDVELGQRVGQGEQLGTIGATGRVTGPHLHWGVSLNDARIDPGLLMPADQRP